MEIDLLRLRARLPGLFLAAALVACGCGTGVSDTGGSMENDADGDGVPESFDCNDQDVLVGAPPCWSPDEDDDDYGDASSDCITICEAPAGYAPNNLDCDDHDARVNPLGTETCNGIDDNCDGLIDDASSKDALLWYQDADADGWGDPDEIRPGCTQPPGAVEDATDCNDSSAAAHPGHPEICDDGLDNDCDGSVDHVSAWPDADGDGYGDSAAAPRDCPLPHDYVLDATDCDDTDPTRNPGAVEICGNGVDEDCTAASEACILPDSLGSADVRLPAESSSDEAGRSVSWAGDVDGDGVADLLVGAPYVGSLGSTYLVLGGALGASFPLEDADATITNGYVVSGAGNVNGDGYDDFIIGSPSYDWASHDSGVACLVLGSAALVDRYLAAAEACLAGEATEDEAGFSVSGAGDANGDGLDDLLVGAPYGSISTAGGSAYLVLGNARPADSSLGSAAASYAGGATGDEAGYAVSFSGDVNADGVDDLLIGAPREGTAGTAAGAAYLVLGNASPGNVSLPFADALFTGEEAGDQAGFAVSGAGDVNGDGFCDLVIGAPSNSAAATDAGAVYLVLGSPTPSSSLPLSYADAQLTGSLTGEQAGWAVSGAGDVDGDGLADVLVGAPGAGSTSADEGVVCLVFGTTRPAGGDLMSEAVCMTGEHGGDEAGTSVSGGGDENADGLDDLLVGAPRNSASGSNGGIAYVVFGSGLGE